MKKRFVLLMISLLFAFGCAHKGIIRGHNTY